MATFSNYQDELKTCPYNPLHRVSARRFQQHLIKCEKSGLYENLAQCPYNISHRVKQEQLKSHMLSCPDNRSIIRAMIEKSKDSPISSTHNNEKSEVSSVNDKEEDNWDNPNDRPSKSFIIPGLDSRDIDKHTEKDFERDFGRDEEKNHDKNKVFGIKTAIEIQRMKPAQRKIYYKDLVQQARLNKLNNQQTSDKQENKQLQNDKKIKNPSPSQDVKPDIKKLKAQLIDT